MKTIISISLFLLSFQVFASAAAVLIEPLYGFEKYYRLSPAPAKFKTRTMLGVRATYGVPFLSAELEVTTGEDSENTPTTTITKSINKREQAKLGLRSNYALGSRLHLFFRAGARAAKDTVSITESGTTTSTVGDINIDPYLGAGIRIIIGANFSLNAGVTGTQIKDDNGDAKLELQTSFSASIKAGSF
jgi:hypothetical protein